MNEHEQAYYTRIEASAYLRCSPRFLDYARDRGELKALRYGRKWIFTKEALDTFARQHSAPLQRDEVAPF